MTLGNRLDLSNLLKEILCSDRVYFSPPSNTKLKYPCAVYKLSGIEPKYADNKIFSCIEEYTITYMTKNPDDVMAGELLKRIPHCNPSSPFVSDGLYHYLYRIRLFVRNNPFNEEENNGLYYPVGPNWRENL